MEAALKAKLADDLKQAMKSGDIVTRSILRMVMAAIKNAEIAKQSSLEDSDILGIIAKDVKRHEESIEAFKKGNRNDLVNQEAAELIILKGYLPPAMDRAEIVAEAKAVIAEVGAQSLRDKGKVMPVLIARLKGRADGREINTVVTELLQE